MEDYPVDYTSSNHALVALSGLGSSDTELDSHLSFRRNGYRIYSESPPVLGTRAEHLKQELLAYGNEAAQSRPTHAMRFHFLTCGREYWLPSRKSVQSPVTVDGSPPRAIRVLHSPLSPLSPGSPLYPDGLMTPLWANKHTGAVPAVFICFFTFSSDPSRNQVYDNRLKIEINAIKGALANSKYKTRLSVVLLGDSGSLESAEHDERLENIRRSTGLDFKNSFFVLPVNVSQTELIAFTATLIAAIGPLCTEYYRHLTRHARRKKNKWTASNFTTPQTSDARQSLRSSGWMLRYEFKMGFFAEFRGELDVASQHYTVVLDSMLQGDGILDTVPRVASRWVEARLLADITAIRTIRCLLLNQMTRMAVSSWMNYRYRMRDTIDRRGKSKSAYAWHAWQARWSKVMADLVRENSVLGKAALSSDLQSSQENFHFASIGLLSGDARVSPWECLHHPGYWLLLSLRYMECRRSEANQIPKEDRVSPDQATASNISRRAESYDTYLCPEPHIEFPVTGSGGYDHSRDILLVQELAMNEFSARSQIRITDRLRLAHAKELLKTSRTSKALEILLPMWKNSKWRSARWWGPLGDLTWTLHRCALATRNRNLQIATAWELSSNVFETKKGMSYDLMNMLKDNFPSVDEKLSNQIVIEDYAMKSFVEIGVLFRSSEGHMGEPMQVQIQFRSIAHHHSKPVRLSKIILEFDGPLQNIEIMHRDRVSEAKGVLQNVALTENGILSEGKGALQTNANLTFRPGQCLILQSMLSFQDTGQVRGLMATLMIQSDNTSLSYLQSLPKKDPMFWWFEAQTTGTRRRVTSLEPTCIKVLPKPPKMEISFPDIDRSYYTNEKINIDVSLFNGEDEEVEASLDLRLLGDWDRSPAFQWTSANVNHLQAEATSNPHGLEVGKLATKAVSKQSVSILLDLDPVSVVIEVKVLYRLISDPTTPVSKTATATFHVLRPFEANYKFVPLLHPSPWPDYFNAAAIEFPKNTEHSSLTGTRLMSRWALNANVVSFASEYLIVHAIDLVLQDVSGGATCTTTEETGERSSKSIAPSEQIVCGFVLDVEKQDFSEYRPSRIELGLEIRWSRLNLAETPTTFTTSLLGVPHLSITTNEPRVLATCLPSSSGGQIIHLDCMLENLSMHFLSFSISMESSDEFAFSGPRLNTVNITPLSRFAFRYSLLPSVQGQYISPKIKVVDRYFTKTLKIYPTRPLEADSQGLLIWVDAEED